MSEPARDLFDARFRWVILQQMALLRNADQHKRLDSMLGDLYAFIRDLVWRAASKGLTSSAGSGAPLADPAELDLATVQHLALTTVKAVLDSLQAKEPHDGLAKDVARVENRSEEGRGEA